MAVESALILVPADSPGGAERIMKLVALELLSRGWLVDVVCLKRGAGTLFSGLPNEFINCRAFILSEKREIHGLIKAFFLFAKSLRRRNYNFTFSSIIHCNALAGLFRFLRLLGTQRLVCRESTIIARRFKGVRRLYYWICYLFYGSIDTIICQTREMAKELVEFAPNSKRMNIIVLPNPIAKFGLARRNELLADNPLFIAIGRLIPEKGFDILLEAFTVLREQVPAARLQIYGEGREEARLTALISKLGVAGCAELCGFTDSPQTAMQVADVCVMSSITEGFPNVLLEMMQVNTRVVATHCADGVADIDGLVTCPTADVKALAAAMLVALNMSTDGIAEKFDAELAHRTPSAFVDAILTS